MIIADRFRGYMFAFIATIAMANVYVFSKASLNELSLYQFGFYWFGLAIVWNLAYAIPTGKIRIVKSLGRNEHKVLVLQGFMELIGTTFFFISIEITTNPAVMSFLQNMVPIFVIIMGLSFLGERFTVYEFIGIIITLAGALVTSFSGNIKSEGLFIPGTGFMIASTLFLAGTTVLSKRYIKKIDPVLLSINRSVYLFIASAILMLIKGESFKISETAIFNTVIGSLVGPFLTALSIYSALKFIEASKSTIIQSSKGFFVIVGAWIYFGTIPQGYQVVGGLITILGVVTLITAREAVVRITRTGKQ